MKTKINKAEKKNRAVTGMQTMHRPVSEIKIAHNTVRRLGGIIRQLKTTAELVKIYVMKLRTANTTGVAAIRQLLDLSQQEMAELLGVSKSTISMVETGRRNLPVTALLKVAGLETKWAAAQKHQELLRSEIDSHNFYSSLKTSIMNYTIALLTTRPDCQALIDIASTEKETLVYRKMGLERQRQSATITSQEIGSNLLAVTTELQALQSVYDTLPEGASKQDMLNNIKRNEYKKFLLEQRKVNYGVLTLLQKEYDIATIDRSVVETDDFIRQLTDRMEDIV